MDARQPPRGLPVYENLEQRESMLRRTWERLDPKFRTPNQVLGRRSTIGCVALEITQRCNLDCTLCYLSESSESVKDLPLEVLEHRIDRIRETYGPGVGVQVTGGDPTLRRRSELVQIVRRIAQRDLRPSLLTNGIRATRGVGLNRLCWDTALVGHPKCNRGVMLAIAGDRPIDLLTNPAL